MHKTSPSQTMHESAQICCTYKGKMNELRVASNLNCLSGEEQMFLLFSLLFILNNNGIFDCNSHPLFPFLYSMLFLSFFFHFSVGCFFFCSPVWKSKLFKLYLLQHKVFFCRGLKTQHFSQIKVFLSIFVRHMRVHAIAFTHLSIWNGWS